MRSLRLAAAAAAACALVSLAGCGGGSDDLHGNAAVVDGKPISMATYDKWMKINAQAAGSDLVPPDFAACVAQQREATPKGSQPTTQQLKDVCEQRYQQLREQTMTFLIQSAWTAAEAAREHVSVSDQEVRQRVAALNAQIKDGGDQAIEQMKKAGLTDADLDEQAKLTVLQEKLRAKAAAETIPQPTSKQLQSFYAHNKQLFASPERRDVQLIGTDSKRRAEQALAQLNDGASWASVYRKFNRKALATTADGKLQAVPPGALPQPIDKALSGTRKGQLFGPVRNDINDSWVIGQVTGYEPARPTPTYDKVHADVRQAWEARQHQDKAQAQAHEAAKHWKAKTVCAPALTVPVCSNS